MEIIWGLPKNIWNTSKLMKMEFVFVGDFEFDLGE